MPLPLPLLIPLFFITQDNHSFKNLPLQGNHLIVQL